FAGHPAIADAGISAVDPAQSLQRRAERRAEPPPLGIIGATHPDRDLAALALLRPRRYWPSRRAAEQCDELTAPHHSITSSARASNAGGTSRRNALAVRRLMMNSNLLARSIGSSAAFSPLRIRPQ